jgi:hypothetical protein
MALSLLAVIALAGQCAPSAASQTLAAIAHVESGLDPLAIGVNGRPSQQLHPTSATVAIKAARRLIAAGAKFDLGLGQINVRNLGPLGLSLADAFDPCRNLAAAAQLIAADYDRAGRRANSAQNFAVALQHRRAGPAVLAELVDLDRTDVEVELSVADGNDRLPVVLGDLADFRPLLRLRQEILGDGAEGPVEDRHVVLDAETEVGVLIERALIGGIDIGGLKAECLVTIRLRLLDAAVPVAVLDVAAPKDDQARLELLGVENEGHGGAPPVQDLCRSSA